MADGLFWTPLLRSLGWSFRATEDTGAPLLAGNDRFKDLSGISPGGCSVPTWPTPG